MKTTIGVSIIIPIYDTGKYLTCCLDSVLSQTLQNIEIICIDDCSSDSSLSILEKYQLKDSRIKVFRHEVNKGLPGTRNLGLDMAQGVYVFFLDSDDAIPNSRALEALYEKAIQDDADITMGRMLWYFIGSQRCFITPTRAQALLGFSNKNITEIPFVVNQPCVTKLFKRNFLEKNKIRFDETLRRAEDVPFAVEIFCAAKTISMIDKIVYFYRKIDNLTSSPSYNHDETTSFYYVAACRSALNVFDKYNAEKELREVFNDLFFNAFTYAACILHIKKASFRIVREFLIWTKNTLSEATFNTDEFSLIKNKLNKELYCEAWILLLHACKVKISLLRIMYYRFCFLILHFECSHKI